MNTVTLENALPLGLSVADGFDGRIQTLRGFNPLELVE
jgi:hypothetical protein